MKINEIRYEQSKNIGQFESRKIAISLTPDETDHAPACIEKLEQTVQFYLNRPEHEAKRRELERERAGLNADTDAERIGQIDKWLLRYKAAAERVWQAGL